MKRATWIGLASAMGFVVASMHAQARPDFSGEWTTAPAAADTATGPERGGRGAARGARGQRGGRGGRGPQTGEMGSGWGPIITIDQDAGRLTVEYPFFSRGDLQPPLTYTYALDGSETVNAIMMGRGVQEERSTATWDAGTLVIRTRQTFEDPGSGERIPVEVTRRLSLEAPDSLVIEVTRSGVLGGEATSTRTVYRKAS